MKNNRCVLDADIEAPEGLVYEGEKVAEGAITLAGLERALTYSRTAKDLNAVHAAEVSRGRSRRGG